MDRLPGDRAIVVPRIIVMRASAHQGNLGKRRSKQVAADAGQPAPIPEDEEMIDERSMAIHRLQFGIDCRIGLAGLTRGSCRRHSSSHSPAICGALSSIRHSSSSLLLPEYTPE